MSFFANLPIARKLFIAFAAVILVMALTSVVLYRNLMFLQSSAELTEHTYQVLGRLEATMAALVDQETGVRGYLVSGDEKFLAPYTGGGEAYTRAFVRVKELTADNAAQQGRLDALNQHALTWRRDVAEKEIAMMAKPETREQARAIATSGAGRASMDGVRALVAEIGGVERDLLGKRAAAQEQAFSDSYMTTVIGGLACLVIAVLMGFVLMRSIAAVITRMTAAMAQLARGDTAVEIPAQWRRDEIGAMAGAVQVFKANMIEADRLRADQEAHKQRAEEERRQGLLDLAAKFENSVGGIVEGVAAEATELRSTAEAMSASAETTTQRSSTVASAAEEASRNFQTVASATEELNASTREIAGQISSSTRMISEAVAQANRTDEQVQELSRSAERIGGVVGLINSIAGQTNLLALNATIEAARAGDAGKGFAVVASEVKSLAAQTAKATDEIAGQIRAMQDTTLASVQAIRSIAETIASVNAATTTIAAAVEEQTAATQEIVRNVQQAAEGAAEVTSNIAGVDEAAQSNMTAASHALTAAGELSKNSELLRSQVKDFLNVVRAA